MLGWYVWDGENVKTVPDMETWAKQFNGMANRRVAKDAANGVTVSTVFLGVDHQFGGGRPLLFETMIFGGEFDQECERYSTAAEARIGHKQWCDKLGIKAESLDGKK